VAAGVYNADFDVAATRTVHRLRPADLWRPPDVLISARVRVWQFGTNGKSDGWPCYFWEKRPAIASGSVYLAPRCCNPYRSVSSGAHTHLARRCCGYTKIAATIRRIKHDTSLLIAILGLGTPHEQR